MSNKLAVSIVILFLFGCMTNEHTKDKAVTRQDSGKLVKINPVSNSIVNRTGLDTVHFLLIDSSHYDMEIWMIHKQDTVFDTQMACYDILNDKLEAVPDQNFNRWKGVFRHDSLSIDVVCQFTTNEQAPERTYRAFLVKDANWKKLRWNFIDKNSPGLVSYFPHNVVLNRVYP